MLFPPVWYVVYCPSRQMIKWSRNSLFHISYLYYSTKRGTCQAPPFFINNIPFLFLSFSIFSFTFTLYTKYSRLSTPFLQVVYFLFAVVVSCLSFPSMNYFNTTHCTRRRKPAEGRLTHFRYNYTYDQKWMLRKRPRWLKKKKYKKKYLQNILQVYVDR